MSEALTLAAVAWMNWMILIVVCAPAATSYRTDWRAKLARVICSPMELAFCLGGWWIRRRAKRRRDA